MTVEVQQIDSDVDAGATEVGSDRQVVVFRLSGEQYGVDIGTVREIIRRQAVTHIPSAPDSVEGMINLRGQTIPVVDLRRRLNLGLAEDTDSSRIIVLDTGEGDVGVIVDEVMAVLRVPRDAISKVAPIVLSDAATYIDGIAEVADSLLMLLDLDEALSAESLRAFRAKAIVIEAVAEPEETDEEADAEDKEEPVAEIEEPDAPAVAEAPEPPIEAPAALDEPEAEPEGVTDEPEPEPEQVTPEPEPESGLPFDVPLVQATFEAIKPRAEELVETFYHRLLEQHPGVAPLFEGVDMKQQRGKLLSAIATVVATLTDLDKLVPHLQELGRRHVAYGAEPAHYGAVGAVLLESIASVAGDAWTPEVEAAWTGAYGVASSVMIEAAEAVDTGEAAA